MKNVQMCKWYVDIKRLQTADLKYLNEFEFSVNIICHRNIILIKISE